MKQLLTIFALVLCGSLTAQSIDTTKIIVNGGYGYQYKRWKVDSTLIVPGSSDTSSRAPRQIKIVGSDIWYTGANGEWYKTQTNAPNSGTVAQLRAMATTTGKVCVSIDNGVPRMWIDIGLNDAQFTDDGIRYIITSNNRVLKAQDASGPVQLSWFAPNDGVADARAGVQAAINYCNLNGIKQLIVDGDYYLSDSVIDRRGGIEYLGYGALLREESWGVLYPSVFTTYLPTKGSSFIIAPNKTGISFDTAAVDPVVFKKIQFVKNGLRAPGKATAIAFRGTFSGPTWPFVVEECNFRGFNYAIKFESPTQQLINFVQINRNAFSQNDECVFFNDIALSQAGSVGQRNLTWGFTFTHNVAHDNTRVIRGMFSKDLVEITDNNAEGNIPYSAGGYPAAVMDIEFSNCSVNLNGNHFEALTGVQHAIKVSSNFLQSNGDLEGLMNTTQNSARNRVYLRGNNFDGIGNTVVPIEAMGCYVFNEDPYRVDGAGVFMAKTLQHFPTLGMSQIAKKEGSVYKFEVGGPELSAMNKSQLTWSAAVKYPGGRNLFMMNTPFGARQMMYTDTSKTKSVTQFYIGGWADSTKYGGVTWLLNSMTKSDFFGDVLFYYNYIDSNGVFQSEQMTTRHTVYGVPEGWSFLSAYFPNPFPPKSTSRNGYFGLPTSSLQEQAILVGSDYTVFGLSNPDPSVIPYFIPEAEVDSAGTFYSGQTIVKGGKIYSVVEPGTIGTLSGVTATCTDGTVGHITVSHPDSLAIGQRIRINGIGYWVRSISGNMVNLNEATINTFTNLPLAFEPPVLKQSGGDIDESNFVHKSGTETVSGTKTLTENLTVNSATTTNRTITVVNPTAGASAQADFRAVNDLGDLFAVGIYSSTTTPFGVLTPRSALNYSSAPGGIAVVAQDPSASVRIAAGGSSAKLTISGTEVSSDVPITINGTASGSPATQPSHFVVKSQLDAKTAAANGDPASANATDLPSAITLINELKAIIISLQAKLRTATLLAP
jgi:hypothetical protein